ncbi:Serine/threonine-protein kinase tel1, partial [Elasticomyces elasticus]
MLQHIAEVCLQLDEYERNEIASCFCLRVLRITAPVWLSTEDEGLAGVAFDIYQWYVKVLFGKRIAAGKESASDAVMIAFANLLQVVLEHHPRYATDRLPSSRTSLLQILRLGNDGGRTSDGHNKNDKSQLLEYNNVSFNITSALLTLFEGYVITEHQAVFDDIVDCLPPDPSRKENIAVQLYLLGQMGCRWRTVLRQAAYHIFETVANASTSTLIAKRVCEQLCAQSGIHRLPELFRLFASQVFYTWLEPGPNKESGAVTAMPFAMFDYNSLVTMLTDNKDEIVAQLSMRQSTQQGQALAQLLDTGWPDLVTSSFSLCLAYAIAQDVTVYHASQEPGIIELSLRSCIDDAMFLSQSRSSLANVVALLVLHLTDDKGIDKALAHSPQFKTASTALQSILQKSSSDVEHPARQDPSYKPKYLPQMLAKSCQLCNMTLESLWSPALLTWVYRLVLDDATPSLGPLHVASVVRKLRIVVAL